MPAQRGCRRAARSPRAATTSSAPTSTRRARSASSSTAGRSATCRSRRTATPMRSSFTLSVGGRELLIDPGTYAYHTQQGLARLLPRHARRTTRCASTARTSRSAGGNFMWLQQGARAARRARAEATPQRFDGWHDGYRRLADPVTHRREHRARRRAAPPHRHRPHRGARRARRRASPGTGASWRRCRATTASRCWRPTGRSVRGCGARRRLRADAASRRDRAAHPRLGVAPLRRARADREHRRFAVASTGPPPSRTQIALHFGAG